MPDWAAKLKTLMDALDLGSRGIAPYLGTSFKHICRVRNGEQHPGVKLALRILAMETEYAKEIAKWLRTGIPSPPPRLSRPKDLRALGRTRTLAKGCPASRTPNPRRVRAQDRRDGSSEEWLGNAGHPQTWSGPPDAIGRRARKVGG